MTIRLTQGEQGRLVSAHSAQSAKGKPLSDCQHLRNKQIASPHARVEHVIGAIAALDGKQILTIRLNRAMFNLSLKAAVYNLRRLCTLTESGGHTIERRKPKQMHFANTWQRGN